MTAEVLDSTRRKAGARRLRRRLGLPPLAQGPEDAS
jgi:hypothetical protein